MLAEQWSMPHDKEFHSPTPLPSPTLASESQATMTNGRSASSSCMRNDSVTTSTTRLMALTSVTRDHRGTRSKLLPPVVRTLQEAVTSSLTGKVGGNDKGRDSTGKWIPVTTKTYRGQGQPMDIDTRKQKQHSEGWCFRCDEKGYLSRDCLNKGKKQEVRAVEMEILLSQDTKIEEVKE